MSEEEAEEAVLQKLLNNDAITDGIVACVVKLYDQRLKALLLSASFAVFPADFISKTKIYFRFLLIKASCAVNSDE